MVQPKFVESQCPECGVTFQQPDDPGRKREYCSNACRQRAYRARGGRASGTRGSSGQSTRQQEQEAWAREQARREQERQRSRQRRGQAGSARRGEQIVTPLWTYPVDTDTRERAKKRVLCWNLYLRANHAGANPAEAELCRKRAEEIRARYGL